MDNKNIVQFVNIHRKIKLSRVLTNPKVSKNGIIIFYSSLTPWPHFHIEIKIRFKHTHNYISTCSCTELNLFDKEHN
jgi:hypothetical protein